MGEWLVSLVVPAVGVVVGAVAAVLVARGRKRLGVGVLGPVVVGGTVALAVIAGLRLPRSFAQFTLENRRRGAATALAQVNRELPGCFSGGDCDRRRLNAIFRMGCFALNGEVDRTFRGECVMPEPFVELSRNNVVVFSMFGERAGGPPDVWVVSRSAVLRVVLNAERSGEGP